MILKGATMSHWWKLLSIKHSYLLGVKQQKDKKSPLLYTGIRVVCKWDGMVSKPSQHQASMRVLVSAWEQQHLTVTSPADQRITHPRAEPALLSHSLKESTQRWEVVSKVLHHWQRKAGLLYVVYHNIVFRKMSTTFPDQTLIYWFI